MKHLRCGHIVSFESFYACFMRVRTYMSTPRPGEVASSEGMKQLRRSLALSAAQLRVGPPPADWKVFLQLRLRQNEAWHPALLQLDGEDPIK